VKVIEVEIVKVIEVEIVMVIEVEIVMGIEVEIAKVIEMMDRRNVSPTAIRRNRVVGALKVQRKVVQTTPEIHSGSAEIPHA